MKHIKTFEGFLSKNLNEAEDSRSLNKIRTIAFPDYFPSEDDKSYDWLKKDASDKAQSSYFKNELKNLAKKHSVTISSFEYPNVNDNFEFDVNGEENNLKKFYADLFNIDYSKIDSTIAKFRKEYGFFYEDEIDANESTVSERFQGAGLQKFVDDTAKHCTDNGGNGENLLQYGLPELAALIDAYYGPANSSMSDSIYTSSTVTAFKKLVVSMAADEIEHNQEEDDV
jgi:hypothetical protein